MRRLLRLSFRLLLVLILCAAALGLWKREEISRLLAVNSLFDAGKIVQNFSHMDQLFLHRSLSRGQGPVAELTPGPYAALSPDAQQWVKDRAVTGLVILHHGQLVQNAEQRRQKAITLAPRRKICASVGRWRKAFCRRCSAFCTAKA